MFMAGEQAPFHEIINLGVHFCSILCQVYKFVFGICECEAGF